jgi:hypothetical protein
VNRSNKNETDIINHKLYTQRQIDRYCQANILFISQSLRETTPCARSKAKRPEPQTRSHPSCSVRVFALLAFLLLLARTLDDSGQVADCGENNISKHSNIYQARRCELTRQLEGEVQRSEQDGKEDPPSQHARDESASASSDEQGASLGDAALSKVPVSTGEAAESSDEGSEDADEDHVGAERADHVDEAEETHPELEETCGEMNRVSIGGFL